MRSEVFAFFWFIASVSSASLPHCGTNNLAYASPFASDVDGHLSTTVAADGETINCFDHPEHKAACFEDAEFIHGVASGDPFEDSVVIWTRITAPKRPSNAIVEVTYTIALDEEMKDIIQEGFVLTSRAVDFTVKVIIDDLLPSSRYYYQFHSCDKKIKSIIGRTKTLPPSDVMAKSVALATVSCAVYSFGAFTAYGKLAERADEIDAVVHVGDYIYEYGNVSPDEADWFSAEQSREPIGKANIPPHETITLTDYRQRYAQYHTDPDLQALHKVLPFIVVPDDHEIADNAYETGAENHDPSEGPWKKRTANGLRAWFEWIPARQFPDKQRFYRDFNFGNLVHLVMLDTRNDNREKVSEAPSSFDEILTWQSEAEHKKIMSDEQMNWITNKLQSSTGHWKVIGNQVPFTDIIEGGHLREISALLALPDSWAGYKASQKTFLDAIQNVTNVVILTGDIHTSAALDVFHKPGGGSYGVEYITPSITAAGMGEVLRDGLHLPELVQDIVKNQIVNANDLLYDIDLKCHGYHVTKYSMTEVTVRYYCAEDIHDAKNKNENESWFLKTCSGESKVLDGASNKCPADSKAS
jgi:alkaline phosphatase D